MYDPEIRVAAHLGSLIEAGHRNPENLPAFREAIIAALTETKFDGG